MVNEKWAGYEKILRDQGIDDPDEMLNYKKAFFMGASVSFFGFPDDDDEIQKIEDELDAFANELRSHLQADSTASSSAE